MLPIAWGICLAPIALFDVRHARGRATFDQELFHEHTIRAFAETWPFIHLTSPEKIIPDHLVAMTPGLHWVLAGATRIIGLGDAGLRVAALLISVAVFGVLGVLVGRRCGPMFGALLVAPLMVSMYVASSAAWVLADNVGWFWVGVLSLLALFSRTTLVWALVAGVGLLLAVWTRQNLLFLALPLWAAAWLSTESAVATRANPFVQTPARLKHLLPIAIATIPSLLTLAYLYRIWGGLVPYEFQGQYDGANPSNIALQLSMLAGFGVFFLPAMLGVGEPEWRPRVLATLRRCAPWVALSVVASAIIVAMLPTTAAPTKGRAGFVWNALDRLDVIGPIGDTNVLMVLIAMAGGAMLVVMLASVPARQRWILGALFAAFAIAQGASSEVWQRYHEPFTLLFLAIATCTALHGRGMPGQRLRRVQVVPIAVLALGLSVMSATMIWQKEIAPWRRGEPQMPRTTMLPEPPPREPVTRPDGQE